MTDNLICTGVIQSYLSNIDPIGWVICDGIPRENLNNIYKNLIEMGIGQLDDENKYVPPNYKNSIIAKIDDSKNDLINLLILGNIKKINKITSCHNYVINKKFTESYNNNFLNEPNNTELDINVLKIHINWIIKI